MRRLLKWFSLLVVGALVGFAIWLYVAPPALIRVATAYAAKIVCSNAFIAGRDPQAVLADDVQAPGHWLLRLVSVDVDREQGTVSAGLLGLFGGGLAKARDGLGCTVVTSANLASLADASVPPAPMGANEEQLWPQGEATEPALSADIAKILDDSAMTGPGMRAVVVVRNGRIAGERYAPGFSRETPLLGWSMTKSVNAALLGTAVGAGRIDVARQELFGAWAGDERAKIAVADLAGMESGLAFNEDYGDVTDVTRMLFLEPDMTGFASALPLTSAIGQTFNYSSGSAVMLSRLWQDAVGDAGAALTWPREKLFAPIGMRSAVMETDASGTFVGSSYLYATARDWARFGLLLLQDGTWEGKAILPSGFAGWMREPAPASNGSYGRGQVWLEGPGGEPGGPDPDEGFDLPADTFWLRGHDGQSTAIIPSQRLVVVRLGLTPSRLGYRPQAMVAALAKTTEDVKD